jgi:modified peptide precursor CbpA
MENGAPGDGWQMEPGSAVITVGPGFLFFWSPLPENSKGEYAMKKENIISYRRKCRDANQGTGLSHYILLTPKAVKKN